MKCTKCGKEFSDKVCRIHKNICKATKKELTDEEVRLLGKEHGIKSYHNKKIDKLFQELKDLGVI